MKQSSGKAKIAVLGGGPSALSAVFHLTAQPGWQEKYEITVYQMGWRLGGKGASGRNTDIANRIEEHGIHLFGNMYANSLKMVDACLKEVDWTPDEPTELQSMDTAFLPSNYQMMADYVDGKWLRQPVWLPHNDGTPWTDPYIASPERLIETLLGTLYSIFTGKEAPAESSPNNLLEDVFSGGKLLGEMHFAVEGIEHLLKSALDMARQSPQRLAHRNYDTLFGLLKHALNWLESWLNELEDAKEHWRWVYIQLDFYITMAKGVIEDDLFTKGLATVDHIDYRDWLKQHGINEMTLNSALPQAATNTCFCYPEGDTTQTPSMSTACYLTFSLRQLMANGQAIYFFLTGTGESIIMPLYRVLKQRGVKFEFFHKVTDVLPDDTGQGVASVTLEIQATVKDDAEYEPLITVNRGQQVWPIKPNYDQLVQGDVLKAKDINLESWWTPWGGVGNKTLSRGEDFDYVILATSIAPLTTIASQLLALRPDWQKMMNALPTIPTQQLQLWLSKTTDELGLPDNLGGTNRYAGPTYVQPNSDFADYTDLLPWEDWPADNSPSSILYFCGPLQSPVSVPPFSDHSYPAQQSERVKNGAIQFFRSITGLLPAASNSPASPTGLDFDALVCLDEASAGHGENRFEQQYWRANIDPNEHYVLSLPGCVTNRLPAWQSGFDNLVLCGDWIYTGFNIASFEGAVMGGMLASYALTGSPSLPEIEGYDFMEPNAPTSPKPMLDS